MDPSTTTTSSSASSSSSTALPPQASEENSDQSPRSPRSARGPPPETSSNNTLAALREANRERKKQKEEQEEEEERKAAEEKKKKKKKEEERRKRKEKEKEEQVQVGDDDEDDGNVPLLPLGKSKSKKKSSRRLKKDETAPVAAKFEYHADGGDDDSVQDLDTWRLFEDDVSEDVSEDTSEDSPEPPREFRKEKTFSSIFAIRSKSQRLMERGVSFRPELTDEEEATTSTTPTTSPRGTLKRSKRRHFAPLLSPFTELNTKDNDIRMKWKASESELKSILRKESKIVRAVSRRKGLGQLGDDEDLISSTPFAKLGTGVLNNITSVDSLMASINNRIDPEVLLGIERTLSSWMSGATLFFIMAIGIMQYNTPLSIVVGGLLAVSCMVFIFQSYLVFWRRCAWMEKGEHVPYNENRLPLLLWALVTVIGQMIFMGVGYTVGTGKRVVLVFTNATAADAAAAASLGKPERVIIGTVVSLGLLAFSIFLSWCDRKLRIGTGIWGNLKSVRGGKATYL